MDFQSRRQLMRRLVFHSPQVARAMLTGEFRSAFKGRGIDFDGLRAGNVTFWSIHRGNDLAGCGALKILDSGHGEIKSMRTAVDFLRQGVAARMLDHVMAEARARGLKRLSLETGSSPAFEPALALYRRYGFADCEPFADYRPDPFSRFMTRLL